MARESIGCVKAATKILGDKWTPQLLRCFANEDSIRFCQIQDAVAGINPRTLSSRLDRLEANGIITKITTADSSRCEYQLTEKGRAFTPVLRDMQYWGQLYADAN